MPRGEAGDATLPSRRGTGGSIEERPEEASEFFRTIPQRRVGDCEADIGRFVALLCGPDAGYVNGQSIALDGGQAFLG